MTASIDATISAVNDYASAVAAAEVAPVQDQLTAANAQIAQLQQQLAAQQNPPAQTPQPSPPAQTGVAVKTVYGTSMGGNDQNAAQSPGGIAATMQMFPNAKIARLYMQMPQTWDSSPMAACYRAGIRYFVLSFKGMSPTDVIAGKMNDAFAAFHASIPDDVVVYWTYWHEPEDDVEAKSFTAADWGKAVAALHQLALTQRKPNVHSCTILMAWTMTDSQRNVEDYYVPAVNALGFDGYQASQVAKACAWAKSKGKHWLLGEFAASDTPPADLSHVQAIYSAWQANPPFWACYWSGGSGGKDFRLFQHPKVAAWLNSL